MRVIAKKILREFWELHLDCEQALKSWYKEALNADWQNLNILKSEYPNASILEDNRVCFNIKGNHYRLIVKINFNYQMMWIRFIGTHPEYDKIDANKILKKIMNLKPIKTEQDYNQALTRLESVFDATLGSKEGDELEILGILIEEYENKHFPIELPDPVEAIKFRMEQLDYSQKDLAEVIGLKSRANEILNRKRKLSLRMIRKLNEVLHIPSDVLIQAY